MKHALGVLLRGLLVFSTFLVPALRGQDYVAAIFLFKAAWYEQDTAGDPTPYPSADDPYDVTATAYLSDEVLSDPDWDLWITGLTLRTPGGRTEGLFPEYESGSFGFYDGAVTAQALNLRYGAGSYRFTLSSVITGASIYNVPLTVDDYPPAPRFSNFEAAQQVDPAKDFTLRWVDFTGVGEREIWLEVVDEATLATVFDAGPLDPSDTSAVIPAGTLLADATYRARLTFTRYTHVSPGTMPETYSGFEAYNTMPLKATSGGSAPDPATITGYRVLENGDLELTANCTPDRTLTLQGAADLNAAWSNLQTTTPTISPAVLTVPKASLGNRLFIRLFQE